MYTGVAGMVKVDNHTSTPFGIMIGLMQGCNLSP